jgi:hypothetical protein
MSTGTVLLVAGLAILGALLFSANTIQEIIRIRRTPTTWINALSGEGPVEVVGRTGQKTLESPIQKRPCVLWQVEVQEEKRDSKRHTTSWSTVDKKLSSEPFEITDDTGKILIRPEGADLILSEDLVSENSQTMALMSSLGIATTNWLGFDKKLRTIERIIAPEKEVFVIGKLQQGNGSNAIAGCADIPLVIADRGESQLLSVLYQRVGINFLVAAVVAGVIIYAFLK